MPKIIVGQALPGGARAGGRRKDGLAGVTAGSVRFASRVIGAWVGATGRIGGGASKAWPSAT
jgi:hypothetical protein